MKKGTMFYGIVCFMLGAMVSGGGIAYAAGILAERSANTVYVDGQRIELECRCHGSRLRRYHYAGQRPGGWL